MITIKKYPNRRLYDTNRSTYVNLEEVTELVRAGHEVVVVDAKTGQDLTQEVLLQIVLEVLHGVDLMPVGLLRRLIRSTGDSPAHALLRQQIGTGMQMMSAQLDRMEALIVPPRPPPPPPAPPAPPPGAEVETPDAELEALRKRLSDLERRLSRG